MRTTKQGDVIFTTEEAKILLDYLTMQKAKLTEDLPFVIDNIRLILMMCQINKEEHNYTII